MAIDFFFYIETVIEYFGNPYQDSCAYLLSTCSYFSVFETMINPKVYKPPPKFSFRNLKKYMPQIKEMAKKEGLSRDKEAEKAGGKKPVKADTVLKFLKDD